MITLQIKVDDHPTVVAGAEDWRFLTCAVGLARRVEGREDSDDFHIHVGCIHGEAEQNHLHWALPNLQPGSAVVIRIIEADAAVPPAPPLDINPEMIREMHRKRYLELKAEFEPD